MLPNRILHKFCNDYNNEPGCQIEWYFGVDLYDGVPDEATFIQNVGKGPQFYISICNKIPIPQEKS